MSFYEFESLKIEKEKSAMLRRYLHFKNIGNVFRILEFLFAILFISWSICRSSPYFSAVFHLLSLFIRRLSILVVNHHFVFLLGNGIIVTLFVKFCQFADDGNSSSSADDAVDEDYQIGEAIPPFDVSSFDIPPQAVTVPDEKRIIPAKIEVPVGVLVEEQRKDFLVTRRESEVKRYRRSRSSVCDRRKSEKIQLRRSETEPRRNSVTETNPIRGEFDDLSDEEFNRKIEAVIAQHKRSLREESLVMVSA